LPFLTKKQAFILYLSLPAFLFFFPVCFHRNQTKGVKGFCFLF
jgi:hypothetical protein